jgi:hypothetical protein
MAVAKVKAQIDHVKYLLDLSKQYGPEVRGKIGDLAKLIQKYGDPGSEIYSNPSEASPEARAKYDEVRSQMLRVQIFHNNAHQFLGDLFTIQQEISEIYKDTNNTMTLLDEFWDAERRNLTINNRSALLMDKMEKSSAELQDKVDEMKRLFNEDADKLKG